MSRLQRAMLYLRTLRRLRPEQLAYRPLRRLQQLLPTSGQPAALTLEASSARDALAAEVAAWEWGSRADTAPDRTAELLAGRYRFLGHVEAIPVIDWNARYVSHLWSYNLHYFDYAIELALAAATSGGESVRHFETLALDWMRATANARGDGWEPYPISLRTVNWMYAILIAGEDIQPDARRRLDASIARQLRVLSRRVEFHVLANHLLKNIKALLIGSLYFHGPLAERWGRRARRLMRRELFEQVLPDGVHFERSPMYHDIVLADLLEIAALLGSTGEALPEDMLDRITVMVEARGSLTRGDGTPHLFNDSGQDVAPDQQFLDRLVRRVAGAPLSAASGPLALPDAGYFGFVAADGDRRLLIDCGPPGPSYQPGHAHCDMLSYELDLNGRSVVVDSGVSGYDGDPLREYVRSTRAHNTVVIGQREQSEVWGTFRMARAAVPRAVAWSLHGNLYRFSGSCSPYHDLTAEHSREFVMDAVCVAVTDRVKGAPGATLRSYLHLQPDFDATIEDQVVTARTEDGFTMWIECFGVDTIRIVRGEMDPAQGWFCPRFGARFPAVALELSIERNDGSEFGYRIHRGSLDLAAPTRRV